ncbi:Alpha/Beta hydrolase protein, partial [Mycena amicta]
SPRSISPALYDDLVLYSKYSSAVYQFICARPLGNTLVHSVCFELGRTQGFIVRDDARQEIVVAFRGTFSLSDAITDAKILLKPLVSPGIVGLVDVDVHWGFLDAYNDVANDVLATVAAQLKIVGRSHYRVVVTGHSLGGAIASLAAPSLKTAFPGTDIKLFTFGQPRVGNALFARYVEKLIGVENIFRAVHTFVDGVPTMLPRFLGYEHFATEYWQFIDPILSIQPRDSVKRCVGEEDPACSASIPSTGINPPHTLYFGQRVFLASLHYYDEI